MKNLDDFLADEVRRLMRDGMTRREAVEEMVRRMRASMRYDPKDEPQEVHELCEKSDCRICTSKKCEFEGTVLDPRWAWTDPKKRGGSK